MPYLWVPPAATKGRLLVADGTSWQPLTVGSNGQVLTADSAQSTGVKWAASSGSVPTETAKATRSSTTQSISDSTLTAISFDTEAWDSDSMVDIAGAPTRVTVKTAGKYSFKAGARFVANNTGDRIIQIKKNGATVLAESGGPAPGSGSFPATLSASVDDDASVNDYYEVLVLQSSGGSLNLAADVRNFLSAFRFV